MLGIIDGENFEIESSQIAVGAEADRFAEGQSVKLVFRPEDVRLSELGDYPADSRYLINGAVEEAQFIGSYERLTVRLEYKNRQPITVTRPKPETIAFPLKTGDKVEISLTNFRVLPNFTLGSERAGKVL